ncbi:MAG: DUF3152 domain-containing protein [Thermoleophilaceae bacterium]
MPVRPPRHGRAAHRAGDEPPLRDRARSSPTPWRSRAGSASLRGASPTAVERTLADRRGWRSPGVRAFRRVDEDAVAFRVTLASPATTDRLCAPLQTNRRYSCFHAGPRGAERAALDDGHRPAIAGAWPTTGATW